MIVFISVTGNPLLQHLRPKLFSINQGIHPNGGTHVLELHLELETPLGVLLVLAGKLPQISLEASLG